MNAVKVGRACNSGLIAHIALLLAIIIIAVPLRGQARPVPSQPRQVHTSARAPLPRLYWYFLTYQRFLDRKADEIEKKGRSGTELRENLQRRLGFSAYQFVLIRDSAQQLEFDLKQKDAQAKAIIDAFHAKYPPGRPLTGPLPPPPPELAILQQERENLIARDVDNLKRELGPKAAAKLDSFLLKNFAPAVKTLPPGSRMTSTPSPRSGETQKAVQP